MLKLPPVHLDSFFLLEESKILAQWTGSLINLKADLTLTHKPRNVEDENSLSPPTFTF